jgi:hypothetical protein
MYTPAMKRGRNDPCSCGSGKKYKKCCLFKGIPYNNPVQGRSNNSSEYRNNHYVPEWYQKRFIPKEQVDRELYYLSISPPVHVDSKGVGHTSNVVKRLGFKHCFAEKDLYSGVFGNEITTKIEQIFFGQIDRLGKQAVEYFSTFKHPSINGDAFNNLVMYMSTQKLRTPKGLAWLSGVAGIKDKNELLHFMLNLRQLFCAIWTECVWLIADSSKSNTKFIVSDHPVTVYNRACQPGSKWCNRAEDPDIRFQGTHTIFPLTQEKILILTNLSWVRNPYQPECGMRPNPKFFRPAMFNFIDIQTLRFLSEKEVREINFIIKNMAFSFIGAAEEEWLYPEKYISISDWSNFGSGYLLMPDPRSVNAGGEIYWGNYDGSGGAIDSYGRLPGDPEFGKESEEKKEFNTLYKFKGEFAHLYGPRRRGRSFQMGQLDPEKDSIEYHNYHLGLFKKR